MGGSRNTGAFVYQGSGKKQSEDAPIEQRKCKKEACNIQYCLARNNHIQKRCEDVIAVWKACCDKAKKAAAKEGGDAG